MHPKDIKQINGRVYGGDAQGLVVSARPESIADVAYFIREATAFLGASGARLVELTLINAEGKAELKRLYAAKLTTVTLAVEEYVDPFLEARTKVWQG